MTFCHKNFCVFLCLFVSCFQYGVFIVAGDDDIFSLLGVEEAGKDARKAGPSTTIPDLVAVASKLLKYKLPDSVFKNKTSSYEVIDATTHKNPSWLYIDADSHLLYALPSPFEQGISVLQISANGDAIAQFTVTVYPRQDRSTSSAFLPPAIKEQLQPYSENSLCNDNGIRSMVIFDQDFEKLSVKEKASLIGRMSDFLSLDERLISLSSWKGYGMNHPDTSVLAAGPGNIIGKSKHAGLEMTWHVACGEFRQLNDFTKILEHNILGGRISDEVGYPVVGWQVLTVGQRKHPRLKRAVNAPSTPVLTSSLPTASILSTTTKTAASTSAVLETSTVVVTRSTSIETTRVTSQMSSTSSSMSSAPSSSILSSSIILDSSTSIKSSGTLTPTSGVSLQSTPSLSQKTSFTISPTPSSIFSSSMPVTALVSSGEVLQSSSMPPSKSSVTPSPSATSALVPSMTLSLSGSPLLTSVPNSLASSAFIPSTLSFSMTANTSATTSVEMTSTPSFTLVQNSSVSSSALLTATPSMLDSSTYISLFTSIDSSVVTVDVATTTALPTSGSITISPRTSSSYATSDVPQSTALTTPVFSTTFQPTSSDGLINVSPTPTITLTSGTVLPTTEQSSVVSLSTLDSSIPSVSLTSTAASSSDVIAPTPSVIQNQTTSLSSIEMTSTSQTSATFQSTSATFQSTSSTFQSTSATFQSSSATIIPSSAFNLTSTPFIPTSLPSSAFESTPRLTEVSTQVTSPSFSSLDVSISTIEPTSTVTTYLTSPMILTSSAAITSATSVSATPSLEVTPSLVESTSISIQPSSDLKTTISILTSSIPFTSSISPTRLPTSTIPVLTLTPSLDSSRLTLIPSPTFSLVDSTIGPSVSATVSGNITYIPSTFPVSSTEASKIVSPLSTFPTVSSSATAILSMSTSEILETTSPTMSMSSIDSLTVTPAVIYSTSIFPTTEVLNTISVTQPTSSFESVTTTSVISASSSMTPSMMTEFSTVQMSTTPLVESSNVSQIMTTVPTAMMTSVDTSSYTTVPTESSTAVPTQSSVFSSGFTSVLETTTYFSTPTTIFTPSPTLNFSDTSSTFASQIISSTTIVIQPTSSSGLSPSFTLSPTSKVLTSLFSSMEPSSKYSVNFTSSSQSVSFTEIVSPSFVTSVDISGSITIMPTKTSPTMKTSSFDMSTPSFTPKTVASSPSVSFDTSNIVTVMPSVSVSLSSSLDVTASTVFTQTDTLSTTGIVLTPSTTQSVGPSLGSSVITPTPVITPTTFSTSIVETGVLTSGSASMDVSSSPVFSQTSFSAETSKFTMTPSVTESKVPPTSVSPSSTLPYTSTEVQTSIISTGILSSLTVEPTVTSDVISISSTHGIETTPVFTSVSTSFSTVPSGLLTSSASTVLQPSSVAVVSSRMPSIKSSVSSFGTDITSPIPTTSVISYTPSPASTMVVTSLSLTSTQSSTIVKPESSSLGLTTPLVTSIMTSVMDSTVIASSSAVLVSSSSGTPTPEVSSTSVPSTSASVSTPVSTMIRPSSTAVVPTSSVVVTTATPTSPVPSEPPVLVKPLTTFDVPFKKYFQIPIPADTFQDPMEGSTRALSLTLLDENNVALKPDSWVQFNRTSQTIEGIALNTAVLASPQQFVLRAENSAGLYVTDAFVITVNQSLANVKRNHLFSATYDIQYDTFISSVPNVITLLNRIGTFFSDGSAEKLQIDTIRSGSVLVDWSNDTLSQNNCDNITIQDLFSRLSYNNGTPKAEFVAAMGTEYPVTNVGLVLTGSCAPNTTISPSTTTSVPSSSVVVTTATATSPVPSEPPLLVKPITTLDVPFKKYFQIQIPADTFQDPMQGSMRALSLTLLDGNNVALKPDSWVQFNRTSQTIEGIALDAALAESPQQFVLRAENSAKLVVTDAFVITVNRTLAGVQRNHLFSATYNLQYDSFMSSVLNVTTLLNRIGVFFSDVSSEKIQVDAIRAGSVIIDWSNDTLPLNTCKNTTINELFSRLSYNNGTPKPEFVTAMGKEYPITNVGVNFTGSCTPGVLPYTDDGTVYIAILVPIIIVLIVVIAIVIYCICNRRKKRLSGRFLLDEDATVYRNDRKPVVMPADLEMSDFYEAPKKPRKPLMFDNEGAENYPSDDVPYEPPVDRPEPPNYLMSMDPSAQYARSSPPPSYHSDTSNPPPSYRLPPPYKNHSKT